MKKKKKGSLLSILLSFSIYPSSRRLVNSMKKKKKRGRKKNGIEYRPNSFPNSSFFFFFLGLIFSLGPYFHEKFPTESLVGGDGDSMVIFLLFRTLLTLQRGISSIENRKRIQSEGPNPEWAELSCGFREPPPLRAARDVSL